MADVGLHGIAYREVMNLTAEDWAHGGRTDFETGLGRIPDTPGKGVSPHTPYSIDTVPLVESTDYALKKGLRTHIHVAEHAIEAQIVDAETVGEFGAGWRTQEYRGARLRGEGDSAVKYLESLGVLSTTCHIAHGIYVDREDRAILRRRGTAVALCPRSNRILAVGEPPVADYFAESNVVALGTDSLSSSPSLDLMDEAAELTRVARRQGYRGRNLHASVFRTMTEGGAAALGMDAGPGGIGRIAPGYAADLAWFDVSVSDPFVDLAEGGGGRCRATVIGGKVKFAR
jgi:cytosine/adenosine deaminase-related metal-dependent hydrolase